MKTKFTPGPWKIDPLSYGKNGTWNPYNRKNIRIFSPDCTANGFIMAECVGPENIPEEQKANAKLIAAAPELLSALENLFKECAMMHKYWGEGDNTHEANEAINKAQAAIVKAKGE